MAVITPKFGDEARVARELLALAAHPRDVATNTDDGFAFVVPDELWQAWVDSQDQPEPTPAMVGQDKRRPGRPRKALPETESEE